jgi:hypothetical protein
MLSSKTEHCPASIGSPTRSNGNESRRDKSGSHTKQLRAAQAVFAVDGSGACFGYFLVRKKGASGLTGPRARVNRSN